MHVCRSVDRQGAHISEGASEDAEDGGETCRGRLLPALHSPVLVILIDVVLVVVVVVVVVALVLVVAAAAAVHIAVVLRIDRLHPAPYLVPAGA
eukprot:816199-Rhodomonas_salina.1